jgi:hypothetical protein
MTWQQDSPLSVLAATVGAGLNARQQAQQRAQEMARQAALDKQQAAYQTAQTAYQQGQLKHTQFEEGRETAQDQASAQDSGLNLSAPAMPTNKNGAPLSNTQLANYYAQQASFYAQNKAGGAAERAAGLAEKFGALAEKDTSLEVQLRHEMNAELETQAKIHHWDAQERQAAQDAVNRIKVAQGHDATSIQDATIHAAAAIAAANTAASSRIQAAQTGVTGAMDRAHYVQGQENQRQDKALKSKVSTSSGGKFRSIPTQTQALMTREAQAAIAKGAPRAAVMQRMAQTHGISVDEANGIYDDNTSGDE